MCASSVDTLALFIVLQTACFFVAGVVLWLNFRYDQKHERLIEEQKQKEDIMPSKKFKSNISGNSLRVGIGGGHVGIDHLDAYGKPKGYLDLSHEDARALAEWLLANTPEPEENSPTLQDWEAMPIGAEFGFGTQGYNYPYTKLTENTYGHKGGGSYRADIRETTPNDHKRGLTWREVPKPTTAEQIRELSPGARFSIGDSSYNFTKLNGDYYSSQYTYSTPPAICDISKTLWAERYDKVTVL